MKKSTKIILFIILLFLIAIISFFAITSIMLSTVKLDKNKLINMDRTVIFYDENGNVIEEDSSNTSITDLSDMPNYVANSFVAIEDERFYTHNGIDKKGIMRALFNDIKSFSVKEGASTISQQLIKNTHLSNEKTLKRKLAEIKLSKQLEKNYSKKEILEMYLNTIYFGNNCYGITDASDYYFDKTPNNLTVGESAILAGIIKAPALYAPNIDVEKCKNRRNLVLQKMYEQNYITDKEYEKSLAESIKTDCNTKKSTNFISLVNKELNQKTKNVFYSGKLEVFTTFSNDLQKKIEQSVKKDNLNCDKSVIVLDSQNNVKAYYSTCGEINRPLGSTIKPVGVYAPSIETDTVNSYSLLLDEKTNFNGYTPSNYNDKYYGYVSVKDSLAKSLNVPAVKLMSMTGVDKCLYFINKTDIKTTENDNSLCLALGATEKGATLKEITASYETFLNDGYYISPSCITKIILPNGKIKKYANDKEKIFEKETVCIMNDMLKETVKNGTAKKLSYLNLPLYAKTGTVGNSKGNTDVYSISYTPEYSIGVWMGNYDNTLLNNAVTGGANPTTIAYNCWENIYSNKQVDDFKPNENLCEIYFDKISYEEDKIIEIADENAPERYKIKGIFKKSSLPKNLSTRFSHPTVNNTKISVNNYGIKLELCVAQYIDYMIYRYENGNKNLIYDSNGENTNCYIDTKIQNNKEYIYSVIPYYKNNDKIYYGNEVYFNKIKTPTITVGDDWTKNEFD